MRRLIAILLTVVCLNLPAAARGEDAPAPTDPLGVLVEALGGIDDPTTQGNMLKGMSAELVGRRGLKAPAGWGDLAAKLNRSRDPEVRFLTLSLSAAFGDEAALKTLRATAHDAGESTRRERALGVLVRLRDAGLPPLLRALLKDRDLRAAALRGLAAYDDPATPAAVLDLYKGLTEDEKRAALGTLASRASFAKALLAAVQAGKIPRADLSAVIQRQLRSLKNADVDRALADLAGKAPAEPESKEQEIARLRAVVTAGNAAPPDPSRGRALFVRTCAVCHKLFGAGGDVGPEITGSNRMDLAYLLKNVVDPSALIGKGYEMSTVVTKDERVIAGIVKQQDNASVTVVTAGETVVLPRAEVEEIRTSDVSMMPEGQLSRMPERDVRDLVAYLQSPAQAPMLASPENAAAFFNGKDLAGWIGCPDLWKVENGEIVGKTAAGIKRNEFLKSDMAVEDFRLVVEVKLVPNEANSGIQFRTEALDDGEVKGYQADVGAGWWGKLYEENGRALLWKKPGDAYVKPGEWNLYEVVAVGHKIRTAINGRPCVDLEDPTGATRGIVAFQIHAGGPTEVRFRNLRLELDPQPVLKTAK